MNCKLCLKSEEIVDSHVISDCFWKGLFDKKHRTFPISMEKGKKLKFIQSGYKEKLLCKNCELKFSVWEDVLYRDFTDISEESSKYLSMRRDRDILFVNNIRYNSFKKAILSILWRMGISNQDFFQDYNLGEYQEEIREILCDDKFLPDYEFPIVVFKCFLGKKHLKDTIFGFPTSKFQESYTVQKIVLMGFYILVPTTEKKCHDLFYQLGLKEEGNIIIGNWDYSDFANTDSVLMRIYDPDVKEMFGKYSK